MSRGAWRWSPAALTEAGGVGAFAAGEIGEVVAFVASGRASFMTGASVMVDAGFDATAGEVIV
jgi:NAD(P)-dependent dehydrogenase (short-subunit alcohol dehydrogenase family)